MASNDCDDQDTDDSKDEDSDSGYLAINHIPPLPPIQVTRLNTVEKLMNEVERYKQVNDQLRTQIFRLNQKVITSERKFRKERTRLESTKNVELMKKDNNIQQAMVKFEKMRKRNTALLGNIKEYENTIKVLETNERELQTKLEAFKDKKKKKLIESESRKTEDNEKELRDLKYRLKDLERELEEKNKSIAGTKSENSKVNETLEGMKNMMSQMVNSIEDSKNIQAQRDLKIESMDRNVNHILSVMHGKTLHNDPRGEDKKTSHNHEGIVAKEKIESGRIAKNEGICAKSISSGPSRAEMSRSGEIGTKFSLIRNRSKSPEKQIWHSGGPTK